VIVENPFVLSRETQKGSALVLDPHAGVLVEPKLSENADAY
ncbi:MAG: hypothetical protein JWM99_1096, partial [Verrucomicrobiales bacterium]|nr:hypothetical protein [Verrucomicrobiales bacterium]